MIIKYSSNEGTDEGSEVWLSNGLKEESTKRTLCYQESCHATRCHSEVVIVILAMSLLWQ